MKLITKLSDLRAVSGGYIVDEFVTENTILFHSLVGALSGSFAGGFFAYGVGIAVGEAFASVCGFLGAVGGAYLGLHYNEYANIKPNTWVRWNVTVVYC